MDVSVWLPRRFHVFWASQAPWRINWTPQVNSLLKSFFLEGVECCFTSINQPLTHKQRSKDLLKFYMHHAMHSTQEATHPVPQQTLFNTDAVKFLIDSGASTHMWN